MRSGEFATIERISRRFGGREGASILLGIGDDAAVLRPPSGHLVWTVDASVERVHFDRRLAGWEDVGYRSFVAAASDLAAMGADPWCALTALVLPPDVSDDDVDALARGQEDASREVGAPIVGGNVARGESLSVTTTLLGATPEAITRGGARPGDALFVAGELGLAAAGLVALQRVALEPECDVVIQAWLRPTARIAEGRRARAVAHAAIDVSDGLAQDAGHLARASGVSAVLDERALLERAEVSGLARACAVLGVDALPLMLSGGEDYALVVASAAEEIEGFWRVGYVVEGEGIALRDARGDVRALEARGYEHFTDR